MNIRNLAKLCGISHTTASLALRNDPRISEAVRRRVQNTARKLGYRPDEGLARMMTSVARGEGYRMAAPIAVLSSWPERRIWERNWVLGEFYSGFERRAAEFAYKLEEFWLGEPGMTSSRMEQILKARGITGVVVLNYVTAPATLDVDLSSFSSVVLGRALVSPRLPAVDHDHYQGLNVALNCLAQKGYRRLGLLVLEDKAQATERTSHQWEAAYLVHHRAMPPQERIPLLLVKPKDARRVVRWIETYCLDAVLGVSVETLHFLRSAGVDVPAKLGFAALAIRPDESTCAGIDISGRVIGAAALDVLADQMREQRRGVAVGCTLLIDGIWRDGGSAPGLVS